MIALRPTAAARARRTRTSSKGFRLLLMVMIVCSVVPPRATGEARVALELLQAFEGAVARGMPSMSPAISAATCAGKPGSLMKRKVIFFICTLAASRYWSFFTSVIDDPLTQFWNLNGPVPTDASAWWLRWS